MKSNQIGEFSLDDPTCRTVRYYLIGNRTSKFRIKAVDGPDSCTTDAVFASRFKAMRFARKMIEGRVLPYTLEEALHDYLYEETFPK